MVPGPGIEDTHCLSTKTERDASCMVYMVYSPWYMFHELILINVQVCTLTALDIPDITPCTVLMQCRLTVYFILFSLLL